MSEMILEKFIKNTSFLKFSDTLYASNE